MVSAVDVLKSDDGMVHKDMTQHMLIDKIDDFFQASKGDEAHHMAHLHDQFTPNVMEEQLGPALLRTTIQLAGPLKLDKKKYDYFDKHDEGYDE